MIEHCCEYVQHFVYWDTPGDTGISHRQRLERKGEVVDDPEPWTLAEQIVEWFWILDAQRGNNGFGPNPIKVTEIQALEMMLGDNIAPYEVSCILAMDAVRMRGRVAPVEVQNKVSTDNAKGVFALLRSAARSKK